MTSNRRPSAAHGPGSRGPGRRRRTSDASADRTYRPRREPADAGAVQADEAELSDGYLTDDDLRLGDESAALHSEDSQAAEATGNSIDQPNAESEATGSQSDRRRDRREVPSSRSTRARQGATRAKRSSPKGRSNRRSRQGRRQNRTAKTQAATAATAAATKPGKAAPPKNRWAEFLPTAGWIAAFLGIIVVLIAVSTVLLSGAGYSTIPAAIGATWMVAHLAPLSIDGTVLGMIPGLPAIGVVALVAEMVRRAVKKPVSIKDVGALGAGVVGVPLLITCIAWLMLWDASKVYAIDPPPLWRALITTALIHAMGFGLGLGQTLWRGITRHYGVPDSLVDSSRLAGKWLITLAGAGLIALVVMLAVRFDALQQTYQIAPGAGAKIALTLLGILYLPNAVVGAASVLLGGDVSIGMASASLFALTPGTLPPMPLLAAMPTGELIPWFAALLVVPAALAVWVTMRHFRDGSDSPLTEVGGATVLSAIGAAIGAVLFGGELGLYGWSGATWWLAGGLAGLWISVIGTCVVLVAIWRGFFTFVDDEGESADDSGADAATEEVAAGDNAGRDDRNAKQGRDVQDEENDDDDHDQAAEPIEDAEIVEDAEIIDEADVIDDGEVLDDSDEKVEYQSGAESKTDFADDGYTESDLNEDDEDNLDEKVDDEDTDTDTDTGDTGEK